MPIKLAKITAILWNASKYFASSFYFSFILVRSNAINRIVCLFLVYKCDRYERTEHETIEKKNSLTHTVSRSPVIFPIESGVEIGVFEWNVFDCDRKHVHVKWKTQTTMTTMKSQTVLFVWTKFVINKDRNVRLILGFSVSTVLCFCSPIDCKNRSVCARIDRIMRERKKNKHTHIWN